MSMEAVGEVFAANGGRPGVNSCLGLKGGAEAHMIDKFVKSKDQTDAADQAVAGIVDGARVMVGGFGVPGQPVELLEALYRNGARDLTLIANNAGTGDEGLAALIGGGRVRKMVCSFPRQKTSWHFDRLYRKKEIELDLAPQGTLVERIRSGGAGIAAFYVRTGHGTELAAGKEARSFDGEGYVLETALTADFALIRGKSADRWGNMTFRGTGRNFAPVMATAASVTIAQVENVVALGTLDPERIDTPGIHVQRVIHVPTPKYVDKD